MTDLVRPVTHPVRPTDQAVTQPSVARETGSRYAIGAYVVFLVLIAATIPWRSKAYYEGGLDAVVVIKGALSVAALVVCFILSVGRRARVVSALPLMLLLAYLAVTVLGGWANETLVPALVIAIRVALLATAIVLLARAYDNEKLLGACVAALATYGLVGAASGVSTVGEGRLSGALPPLHPNELASISAIVVTWCLWKMTNAQDRLWHLGAIAIALPVLLLTGSRTPLFALSAAAVVLIIQTRALRPRTIAIGLIGVPVVLWVVAITPVIQQLVFRGQDQAQLTTLSNRTIAWQSALAPKSSAWLDWFGGGLTMKRIDVKGQWWNQQILDSSWISALVQGGLIGAALCLLLVFSGVVRAVQSRPPLRALQLALIVYLALRGILESGLFDASTAFLLLFTVILTARPET